MNLQELYQIVAQVQLHKKREGREREGGRVKRRKGRREGGEGGREEGREGGLSLTPILPSCGFMLQIMLPSGHTPLARGNIHALNGRTLPRYLYYSKVLPNTGMEGREGRRKEGREGRRRTEADEEGCTCKRVHSTCTCTRTSAHMYSRWQKERGELHVQYMYM